MIDLARHAIVHVDPAAAAMLAAAVARDWITAGRPLVVRRRDRDDPADTVALGLPLPPAMGKHRIALTVPPEFVTAVAPPPLLRDTLPSIPPGWRPDIDRLIALDPQVRVFGSLAWQHLTGLPYLTDTSDLDLLWPSHGGIAATLAAVAALDTAMRIDGEVILSDGTGIHWREFAGDSPAMLGKRLDGAVLIERTHAA